MKDPIGDTCCPSGCQIASSKTICAKRIAGWLLLCLIVTVSVYGVTAIVSNRSEKHSEQVYELNTAITEWTNEYQEVAETWSPKLVNELNSEYSFEELNSADFHSQFSDLDVYKPVKYTIANIKEVVKDQTSQVIASDIDGSFNITTTLLVKFSDGESLTLENIPLYSKKKSARSQKDCNLNRVGIYNTTDNTWYTFNQLTRACYIIDQDNFPNLVSDYESFPCDEINRHYAAFTFYRWTDADSNPTFQDFHAAHDITLILRSNKDPYVIGYTKVDIVKNTENNVMILFAVLVGVLALLSLYIPLKLIMTEDSFAPISTGEKLRFMRRV